MKYIYLDESGELGFSKASSRYFTITLLVCDPKAEQELQRVIKKIRQKKLKKKLKESPEIKWNNSSDWIKDKVFEKLKNIKFEIFTIILDKSKVYNYLRGEKHRLYNYLTQLIITECSMDGKTKLVVDRSKNKRSLRDDFDQYIRGKVKDRCEDMEISHEDSKNNGVLQTLDFVSGAIFNKYGFEKKEYYDKIKEKITTEKNFLG